jgi:hypothetical protein
VKTREASLTVEGFRERWITTLFGDVRIKRRLYRDSSGHSRFLLDEALGLRERSQSSPKVEELATFLSSHLLFGECEQLLKAILPGGLSHTTIHRLVGRTVDPYCLQHADAKVFTRVVVLPFILITDSNPGHRDQRYGWQRDLFQGATLVRQANI